MIRHQNGGFTLIELIITIVLVGLLGAMFVQFMGSRVLNAPDATLWAEEETTVEEVMERIMADYLVQVNGATPDNALTTIVGNEATYESLGADVDFEYITFDSSGNEVVGSGPSDPLKITVYVADGASEHHRMVTILTLTRVSGVTLTPLPY